jgi:hypothetical protein
VISEVGMVLSVWIFLYILVNWKVESIISTKLCFVLHCLAVSYKTSCGGP